VVLREGEAALARRDYGAAEAAAREALGSGRSTRAADAQFLLAEALAAQRNYPQAAMAFDDAYRRSPTGQHAQEALLGMASALANLGSKPAACAALDKLQTEFLTQRGSVREAAAALRQRQACHS
jgi:TolA-binding protein